MDIILKKMTFDDIEQVRIWRNSEEVSKYMYTSDNITIEQQLEWFNKIDSDDTCRYFIIMYNNKMLGVASITGISKALDSCYWAFYLGDTSIRGAGIGSKVEYNILRYVFEELKLNKLRCEVFVNNDMVINMHESFGFRREAYYREHCIKEGVKLDAVGLAMLKSEWEFLKNILYEKVYNKNK